MGTCETKRGGSIMNRTLTLGIGALALAAMTNPTSAADIPRPAPPVVAPPVVYNWSGFYIGGNLGGKWADHGGDIYPSTNLLRSDRPQQAVARQSPGHPPGAFRLAPWT
jgi:hypothetical protein